tara:strand:- start:46 stop:357 length:312 start_codon:yes stop_codon:yes gene_type:complete
MSTAGSIAVPTAGGLTRSLSNYGVGLIAGIGYRLISGFTGSGLIGGAIAAAATGAMVKGVAGEIIAVNAGFLTGQQGLGNLGLGNFLGGGRAGAQTEQAIETI